MSAKHRAESVFEEEWEEPARKRLRPDLEGGHNPQSQALSPSADDTLSVHGHVSRPQYDSDAAKDKSITIASTAKLAPQTVAPFLARHIPDQYAPLGSTIKKVPNLLEKAQDPNSKFCYRHRPDMLCRRQADEPSMEKLQKVRRAPHAWMIWLTLCPGP